MKLTDIKQMDNDYAIIDARYCLDDKVDITRCNEIMERKHKEFISKIEKLAELGQEESMMWWYEYQTKNKIQGRPVKTNSKIDEQFSKMNKNSLRYKFICIDKLEGEGETFECIKKLNELNNEIKNCKKRLQELKEINIDSMEKYHKTAEEKTYLNHKIAENKLEGFVIWQKILHTPYYVEIKNLLDGFRNLLNEVSVLDMSFLYRNIIVYAERYNRALSKVSEEQRIVIAKDVRKFIEPKLKALYKAEDNKNIPYVALRYANFLRNDNSLVLQLSGRLAMKKVANKSLSKDVENLLLEIEDVEEKEFIK